MAQGLVVSGEVGRIVVRARSDAGFELGELLAADSEDGTLILQLYDLIYGSQLPQQQREFIAGLTLEEGAAADFVDAALRNYVLALAKCLVVVRHGVATTAKSLPSFFAPVREVTAADLAFLSPPADPLEIGYVRSGSRMLDVPVSLPASLALSHHILIAGTTGRGKSVLVKNILWSLLDSTVAGALVLDPHDEYYGRSSVGLKDHPARKVVYFTGRDAPPGCRTLRICLACLRPHHFNGIVAWSDPQEQLLVAYHRRYRERWVEAILLDRSVEGLEFHEATVNVVKRRLSNLLDLTVHEGRIITEGVFDMVAGATTVPDIVSMLEAANVVIIDTSLLGGDAELLVGSLIAAELFSRYRHHKSVGAIAAKPVVTIVLEEAPRVIGRDALERGPNVFASIAREGRKFKIGLTAITQLPSLIPREILANINTKILLGIEMRPERQAIIESAAQDLADDDRTIASLDRGEALVTSNFIRFATPVRIPFFDDRVRHHRANYTSSFAGVKPSRGQSI